MRYKDRRFPRIAGLLIGATLLLTMARAATVGQETQKMKKFLTRPLVIEDQGSFFIGGVPKVTNYATVAPPGAPATGTRPAGRAAPRA